MISLIPLSAPERRAVPLMMRAEVHVQKGDDGLAIQDLDEAIRLRPQDPDVLELALPNCNESLSLRPNHPNTLDSRGFTYLKLKQPERAINDYDAVLQIDPKNAVLTVWARPCPSDAG